MNFKGRCLHGTFPSLRVRLKPCRKKRFGVYCECYASIARIIVELARKISVLYASEPVRVLTVNTEVFFLYGAVRDEYAIAYECAWNALELASAIANMVRIEECARVKSKRAVQSPQKGQNHGKSKRTTT